MIAVASQLKIAPTVALSGILLSVHVFEPVGVTGWFGTQFDDHPPNVEPVPGVAVKITVDPMGKYPTHPEPEPQSITTVVVPG
jgi:hypothetical protein